jgi:hypothetical protein
VGDRPCRESGGSSPSQVRLHPAGDGAYPAGAVQKISVYLI